MNKTLLYSCDIKCIHYCHFYDSEQYRDINPIIEESLFFLFLWPDRCSPFVLFLLYFRVHTYNLNDIADSLLVKSIFHWIKTPIILDLVWLLLEIIYNFLNRTLFIICYRTFLLYINMVYSRHLDDTDKGTLGKIFKF